MVNSIRYSVTLKPTNGDIRCTYCCFNDLKELLYAPTSRVDDSGVYYLNNNLWFNNVTIFHNQQIKHPNLSVSISSIQVKLSKNFTNIKKKQCRKNFNIMPKNVYGIDKLSKNKEYFNRGHLIAASLLDYADNIPCYKWQDFVMITDWCNRANTVKGTSKAFGMFHFENIILRTVEEGVSDIDYRVTPVFKKLDEEQYEFIPRGIILEAKTTSKVNFQDVDYSEFNVFIPNAQFNLQINYRGFSI